MTNEHFGRMMVVVGLVVAVLGAVVWSAPPWLTNGRWFPLPGDLVWRRGNTTIAVPLTTMLLVSVVLNGLWWLVRSLTKPP